LKSWDNGDEPQLLQGCAIIWATGQLGEKYIDRVTVIGER